MNFKQRLLVLALIAVLTTGYVGYIVYTQHQQQFARPNVEPNSHLRSQENRWKYRGPAAARGIKTAALVYDQGPEFLLWGRPFRIISGALHYFRVPKAYWLDRLQKLKYLGCNTVETYVPFNFHETSPGIFDFDQGQRDLGTFLRQAQELGLYVLLRPSPYICSEWDFGGLPARTLGEGSVLRSMDPTFMATALQYYDAVLSFIVPFQACHGGPIIAFYAENELASFSSDVDYLRWTVRVFREHHIVEAIFTCENAEGLGRLNVTGVLPTVNFQTDAGAMLRRLREHVHAGPLMVSEFWTGWFDHWNEDHHTYSEKKLGNDLEYILIQGASVNFYMFHGGTNFGFYNGANGLPYAPDTTSYDYDALLTEDGRLTPKFHWMRTLLRRHLEVQEGTDEPQYNEPQAANHGIMYDSVRPSAAVSLFDVVQQLSPIRSDRLLWMEDPKVAQSFGYILYRVRLAPHTKALTVTLQDIRDRAIVYADQKRLGIFERWMVVGRDTESSEETQAMEVQVPAHSSAANLDILVENCGRINYGAAMRREHKGLGELKIDGIPPIELLIYPLSLDEDFIRRLDFELTLRRIDPLEPVFYKAALTTNDPRDIYIDSRGWGRGAFFINGFNLGRYDSRGPQLALYLPGPFHQGGSNDLIAFETDGERLDPSPMFRFLDQALWRTKSA